MCQKTAVVYQWAARQKEFHKETLMTPAFSFPPTTEVWDAEKCYLLSPGRRGMLFRDFPYCGVALFMSMKATRIPARTMLQELPGVVLLQSDFKAAVPGVSADMEINVYEVFCVQVPVLHTLKSSVSLFICFLRSHIQECGNRNLSVCCRYPCQLPAPHRVMWGGNKHRVVQRCR